MCQDSHITYFGPFHVFLCKFLLKKYNIRQICKIFPFHTGFQNSIAQDPGRSVANAAAAALATNLAAAAVTLAAILLSTFNINNLPNEVKTCHQNHMVSTFLMTNNDMQPFPTPTMRVCPCLSYLGPSMGTGVVFAPDSNQVITRSRQFFSLTDQGTSGLKVFLNSVPSYHGTSAEAIHSWYINVCTGRTKILSRFLLLSASFRVSFFLYGK